MDKCGTTAGFWSHRSRKEPICSPCREAWNARCREVKAQKRGKCSCGAPIKLYSPQCRECADAGRRERTRQARLPVLYDASVCWLPERHPAIRGVKIDPPRRFVAGRCEWCDGSFIGLRQGRFCSRRCIKKAGDVRAGRGRFRISPVVRLAIYERDGWTCQLCLEPVDANLMTLNPSGEWAPTLDHVVPQSKGGSDDPSNLRLAHRWCNSVRSDETYYTEADLRGTAA